MAKKSTIENNMRRERMVQKYQEKRAALKAVIYDKSKSMKEVFAASMALASLPRNSSKIRCRNRCFITGRARGYYRRFGISRIKLRELASSGMIPGVRKASW